MGRPREFDEEVVLDRAMEAFWSHGYKGSNLPELLEAMGLTRGSFYKAFGSKREMFLMALDAYIEREIKALTNMLTDQSVERDALKRLEMAFEHDRRRFDAGDRRGCFVFNMMTEIGESDPDVARHIENVIKLFGEAIDSAIDEICLQKGHLFTPEEKKLWREVLFGAFISFRVGARAGFKIGLPGAVSIFRQEVERREALGGVNEA